MFDFDKTVNNIIGFGSQKKDKKKIKKSFMDFDKKMDNILKSPVKQKQPIN